MNRSLRSRKCFHRCATFCADPLAGEDAADRHEDDLHVQREANMVYIVHIVGKPFLPRRKVSPVHLCPAGKAGANVMSEIFGRSSIGVLP